VPRHRLILNRSQRTVLSVATGVVALDIVSKTWARHVVARHAIHVVGPLWFRLEHNTGLSYSFHGLGWFSSLAILVAAVAVVVVAWRARSGAPAWGLGLLVGGGVANLADRATASPPGVTDFVSLGSFPVFNLADAAITIGCVCLLVVLLRGRRLTQ